MKKCLTDTQPSKARKECKKMKYIDKFLKKLNVNRNTFATYILTLISIYLIVDRVTEMLIMIFTGVSVSYWGPIKYTLAMACPIFAFLFSGASSFASTRNAKVKIFYAFAVGLYIIALSMFVQWANIGSWLFLLGLPGYTTLVTDFSYLIRPALTALAIYLPIVTFKPFLNWIILGVDDSLQLKRSLWDYQGINLSDKQQGHGPYTCDLVLFKDKETGKTITFPAIRRFQSLLVVGGSGTGKTALVFEPFVAKDLERKFFFMEVSREMGYTALKTGIATLNCPYDNDYINKNFSLNMLTPTVGKEKLYKAFMKKMLLSSAPEYVYQDLGLTLIAPDLEIINHIKNVCDNFGLSYNYVDPSSENSIGLNPFEYKDAVHIASLITTVLKGMYMDTFSANGESVTVVKEAISYQAIENLVYLLKEMYPRLHEGALPNLEDLQQLLTNFDKAEEMCRQLEALPDVAANYYSVIAYFKKHFYKDAINRKETEAEIDPLLSQLDNLLRIPSVKNVLCNRYKNINFDNCLANGEITLVCTQRGDLGANANKAFGLFYLLSFQTSVLRRPGGEDSRVPHFLYVDEFADFVNKILEPMFISFRKYKVANTISIQSLQQLEKTPNKVNLKNTILSNCANKLFLGNATPAELEWWSSEFGTKREWRYTDTIDFNKKEYDPKHGNVEWKWVNWFMPGKLNNLAFKICAYKIKGDNGMNQIGEGMLNFLDSKYDEEKQIKTYNFTKFTSGIASSAYDDEERNKKSKFNPSHLDFTDERNEINPVQTDLSDSNFLLNNDDAIIFDFKKKKKNNDEE